MLKQKRLISYVVILNLLVLLLSTVVVVAETKTELYIYNQSFNGVVVNRGESLMASAKELANMVGAEYNFDNKKGCATISIAEHMLEIRLTLDSNVASINGKNVEMPEPVQVEGMRIIVPVQFITENLGGKYYYNVYKDRAIILKPIDGEIRYNVQYGDTLWILSKTFLTSIPKLKSLNGLTGDMIYPGQVLTVGHETENSDFIYNAYTKNSATVFTSMNFNSGAKGYLKAWTPVVITGKQGNWYFAKTPVGEGYLYSSILYIPQEVYGNGVSSAYFEGYIPLDTSMDRIEHEEYTVVKGDTLWSVANQHGITHFDLAKANNIPSDSYLSIGQVLKIPVRIIEEVEPALNGYGQVLDWFTQGQYILPIGKEATITDMTTGKSFMIKRTIGANHADVETLTLNDTNIMKEIFGGTWSWTRRPCFLDVDGRRLAISISGMPHAGIDGVPFMQYVDGRSDDWGYGPNFDVISGNGMDGHFDLYFLNCLRHKDNQYDSSHQQNVLISGGLH